jgi:hypothetical protein
MKRSWESDLLCSPGIIRIINQYGFDGWNLWCPSKNKKYMRNASYKTTGEWHLINLEVEGKVILK